MIEVIIWAIVNLILSALTTYGLRLPGFDLTLVVVMFAARSGDSVFWPALLLTIAYALPKPSRFVWAWMQFLLAWLVGWVAVAFNMVYLPIILFHALATIWVVIVGAFSGRHVIYTLINLGLTMFVFRFYFILT